MRLIELIDWLDESNFFDAENNILYIIDEGADGDIIRYITHYDINDVEKNVRFASTSTFDHLENSKDNMERLKKQIQNGFDEFNDQQNINNFVIEVDGCNINTDHIEDNHYFVRKK